MPYQVLARKWRPASFRELVGQQHVLRALVNALERGQLHHAYLFTGTRGVGKTTIARILARCLNCETGVTAEPCGTCDSCREISEGRSVDLMEVDAASRTKVEDTRELLENVHYAPTRGRFRIYLIDEVHMLSVSSFNALLKTLEEPPEHAKFLLATTDPQRLPATVLSRCLQFNLKNMPPDMIARHLEHVLVEEGVSYDAEALTALGEAAAGSMRDALSLTDQAIAFGAGELRIGPVSEMLGTVDGRRLHELLHALVSSDGKALLAAVQRIDEHAPDYERALDQLASLLHRTALLQLVPDIGDDDDELRSIAGGASAEDVQLWYQICLQGKRDLPYASTPRTGFEMALLRALAFRPLPPELSEAGEVGSGAKKPDGPRRLAVRAETAEHRAALATEQPQGSLEEEASRSAVGRAPEPQQALVPDPIAVATPAPGKRVDPAPDHAASAPPVSPPVSAPGRTPEPAPGEDPGSEAGPASAPGRPEEFGEHNWHEWLERLRLTGSLQVVASHCVVGSWDGHSLRLVLDLAQGNLFNAGHERRLARRIGEELGREVSVTIAPGSFDAESPAQREARLRAEAQARAEAAIEADPGVRRLLKRFDGALVPGSVRPRTE